jgi:hypothetical protein
MGEFYASLNALEKVFLYCAALGGFVFIIRVALMFIGADADDIDVGGDVDFDMDAGDALGDSDASFKLLNLQGITGFLMMFGLVGLSSMREFGMNSLMSVVCGSIAGYATLWILAWVSSIMMSMQSSGTLNLSNAIGQEGTIYLRIPKDGTGKVRVAVQKHLKVMDAVAEDKKEIKDGERVQVVSLVSGNVLVVKKA